MRLTQTTCSEIYFQKCFSKEAELPKKHRNLRIEFRNLLRFSLDIYKSGTCP